MRTVFVTGTDTGVGKTVVTALMAAGSVGSVALKPFCSGERSDAELLASITGRSVNDINPWFYEEGIAPWTAARKAGATVTLPEVVDFVRGYSADLLLVEGAGGVLTPLGERLTAADLIRELRCEVVLVAANRLGVLNQVSMALTVLQGRSVTVGLVEQEQRDDSTETNLEDLELLWPGHSFFRVPFLPGLRKEATFFREAAETVRLPLPI